jgi:hypothetical protein
MNRILAYVISSLGIMLFVYNITLAQSVNYKNFRLKRLLLVDRKNTPLEEYPPILTNRKNFIDLSDNTLEPYSLAAKVSNGVGKVEFRLNGVRVTDSEAPFTLDLNNESLKIENEKRYRIFVRIFPKD